MNTDVVSIVTLAPALNLTDALAVVVFKSAAAVTRPAASTVLLKVPAPTTFTVLLKVPAPTTSSVLLKSPVTSYLRLYLLH